MNKILTTGPRLAENTIAPKTPFCLGVVLKGCLCMHSDKHVQEENTHYAFLSDNSLFM